MPMGLQAWCGCFQPLSAACGSFLPVINPVVIPGLRAGICCAVLRGSLYVCTVLSSVTSVRLSSWINKGDYYYYYYYITHAHTDTLASRCSSKPATTTYRPDRISRSGSYAGSHAVATSTAFRTAQCCNIYFSLTQTRRRV